jgi:hypothetical protein
MNITKKISLISLAFMALLLSSCQEEIDLELNDSFTRLVVEGNITTDSAQQKIMLSTSSSYFSNEKAPIVSGAQIQVFDGNQSYPYVEDPNNPGTYYSQQILKGNPGTRYELKIDNVDLGEGENASYTATETMKVPMIVDSIYAIPTEFFGIQGYRVFGFAQEPPTVGDFYMWRYYVNGKLVTDTLSKLTFGSDELLNGNYVQNLELGFFDEGLPGDTLTVETNTITEGYYNFIISFIIETIFSGGGFSGPPANIKTNLDNGAVGYFNTEARSSISIVLP